jgi:hypothetical protein
MSIINSQRNPKIALPDLNPSQVSQHKDMPSEGLPFISGLPNPQTLSAMTQRQVNPSPLSKDSVLQGSQSIMSMALPS